MLLNEINKILHCIMAFGDLKYLYYWIFLLLSLDILTASENIFAVLILTIGKNLFIDKIGEQKNNL